MIPKVIHYCWFGGNPKSDIIKECIESWKTHLPDFEIIEWNENNFDTTAISYTKEAYEQKKWAFVTDYVRLKVVLENGGMYLDTDVLLHGDRLKELLRYDCWFAQEDTRYVSTGLGFGAIKGHPLLKAMTEVYENTHFGGVVNSEMDMAAIKSYCDWTISTESRMINDVFFVGLNDLGKYVEHLGMVSWKNEDERKEREQRILNRHKHKWRKTVVWKIACAVRTPAIQSFMEKRGGKLQKIYLFCAYDLIANGVGYYIKRVFTKKRK